MLGEDDLLLCSLDGGQELGIIGLLELLTSLFILLVSVQSCRKMQTSVTVHSQCWSAGLPQPSSRLQLGQVPVPGQPV